MGRESSSKAAMRGADGRCERGGGVGRWRRGCEGLTDWPWKDLVVGERRAAVSVKAGVCDAMVDLVGLGEEGRGGRGRARMCGIWVVCLYLECVMMGVGCGRDKGG